MLKGTEFTLKVGIHWCQKTMGKNNNNLSQFMLYLFKYQNCAHNKDLHEGKVNMLPMDAMIPSKNKINFITT